MGKNLSETLIAATGLPTEPVEREFQSLLNKNGKSAEDLTLEELREVMAEYLQTVFLELNTETEMSA